MLTTQLHYQWEVWPETHGYVQIYASTDPKHFDKSTRVVRCKISDKICDITLDKTPDTRYYFLLQFDKKNQRIVASRAPNITNICNLRDLGGYETSHQKAVKWGYLFRSAAYKTSTASA